jgi:CSLREA domain-containing protein
MSAKHRFARKAAAVIEAALVLAVFGASAAFPTGARALGPIGFAIEVDTAADNTVWDGFCSLREAIENADLNAAIHPDCTTGGGDDGIFFSDALGTATIVLGSTLPVIDDSDGLTIYGGGDISISGNGAVRAFYVNVGGRLTLDGLTLRDGWTVTGVGGAIYNRGILSIVKCTFRANHATAAGGAIINATDGSLTVTDSSFVSNIADNQGGGVYNEGGEITILRGSFADNEAVQGGAIANLSNQGAMIRITGTGFSGNLGSDAGGAIYNNTTSSINISAATFLENEGSRGGAIYNDKGTLAIKASSLSNNLSTLGGGVYTRKGTLFIIDSVFAGNLGGGVYNDGSAVQVTRGTFTGNRGHGIYNHWDGNLFNPATLRARDSSFTKNSGSGIFNDYAKNNIFTSTFDANQSGGIYNSRQSVTTVVESTFHLNVAKYGGGVYNDDSYLFLHNDTFSENAAWARGGGVYNTNSGFVEIKHTTISFNWAPKFDGLFNEPTGTVDLSNSILANGASTGNDCANEPGGSLTGNNNLIEALSGDACGLIDGVDGNIIGLDPMLLAPSGSPAYYPLDPGSPAIDRGDDMDCAAVSYDSQNGVTRPQGAACDIGSYEYPFEK